MKKLFVLKIFFSVPAIAFSGIPCSMKTVVGNIEAVKVNHKNTYALFSPHLKMEPYEIEHILKSGNDKGEIASRLRSFLQSNSSTAEQEKQDVSNIVSLLAGKPEIRWLGIEASKEELATGTPIKKQIKNYLQRKSGLKSRYNLSEAETNSLLHLMFSNYIIAGAENPRLFGKIKFVPLDNDFYKGLASTALKRISQTKDRIRKRAMELIDEGVPENKRFSFQKFQEVEAMRESAFQRGRQISEAQTTTVLGDIEISEYKQLLREVISHTNNFIGTALQRDSAMAQITGQQAGEGLIILGSAHRPGVTSKLLSLCRGL